MDSIKTMSISDCKTKESYTKSFSLTHTYTHPSVIPIPFGPIYLLFKIIFE